MRDYMGAVRACFEAFRGAGPLDYHSRHYELTLLPGMWSPGPVIPNDPPIDLAAVNPWMLRLAGELADGVHVHPLHSMHYLEHRLEPAIAEGAARAGRSAEDIDLLVPVFIVAGDTPEDRCDLRHLARTQIASGQINLGIPRDRALCVGTEVASRLRPEDLKAEDVTDELRDRVGELIAEAVASC